MKIHSLSSLQRFFIILAIAICIGSFHCGSNESYHDAPSRIITITFENKSQFDIHHIFLYPPDQTYLNQESKITQPLSPGNINKISVNASTYLATVTRRKNKDGPLIGLTTAYILEANSSLWLECYDDSFRLRKDSFPTLDNNNQGVLSSSNNSNNNNNNGQ